MNTNKIREAVRELLCILGFHTYEEKRARASVVTYKCIHCEHELFHLDFS